MMQTMHKMMETGPSDTFSADAGKSQGCEGNTFLRWVSGTVAAGITPANPSSQSQGQNQQSIICRFLLIVPTHHQ